ncbi:MAG: pyridine nucleotide-disulfide oxidoreductase [Promethearchaeia archaeon]|nr:MAG: pyridine nucleotide-disulfide oxidoreductase [Candidatus Lokiarchaeia archaeon]
MMKETDVLVVGGGPAALITSVVAAQMNPNKKIMTVRNFPNVPIPCGIPYAFGQLKGIGNNVMPDASYKAFNIDLVIDEVVDGDKSKKIMELKSGEKIKYDKLVLATGSKPIVPKFITGYDKPHVYYVSKDNSYLEKAYEATKSAKKIVIIGAGFIGMEFADELLRERDKKISIIEMLPNILGVAFDREISDVVEEKFRATGVNLLTGKKVTAIDDNFVHLETGEQIEADMVICAIGARPNTELATKLELRVERNGIWVDEYLRTSDKDIFAVGDCAAKIDFFTRRPSKVMLASTACAEARIAGANLFGLQVVRENKGTIGVFSTNLQGLTIATAGLTQKLAEEAGFNIVTGTTSSKDRHPGKFADTSDVKVKLIFSKNCGTILGGQVISGGKSAAEMINVISVAIQQRMSIAELFTLQFGTHPLITSAPTTYPIITAAQKVLVELKNR